VNTSNAVMFTDTLDAAVKNLSPIRGPRTWFDGGIFYEGDKTKTVKKGEQYLVPGMAEGWQCLENGQPAKYIMQEPGKAAPPKPDVPESEWPKDLSGKPQHPWRWTRFLYLMAIKTGKTLTFTTNTTGGRIAIDDLLAQIQVMRALRPGALPIISLESEMFKTQFGMKPKPLFEIKGWRGGTETVDAPKAIAKADPDDPIVDLIG
jgi:hypothetical protein